MLPFSFKKMAVLGGVLYAGALPVSFLVGGYVYSRPFRTGLNIQEIISAVRPEWDRKFLSLMREVEIDLRPRVEIRGTVFGANSHSTVIVLHSRGENRLEGIEAAYALWDVGFDVLLLDRYAHGLSDGDQRPLFGGEEDEISAVISAMVKHQWSGTSTIGVFGIGDAGTSALVAAARDPRIDAASGENPAVTATDMIRASLATWAPLPDLLLIPHAYLSTQGMRMASDATLEDLDASDALSEIGVPSQILSIGTARSRDARRVFDLLRTGVGSFESGPDRTTTYAAMVRFFEQSL